MLLLRQKQRKIKHLRDTTYRSMLLGRMIFQIQAFYLFVRNEIKEQLRAILLGLASLALGYVVFFFFPKIGISTAKEYINTLFDIIVTIAIWWNFILWLIRRNREQ